MIWAIRERGLGQGKPILSSEKDPESLHGETGLTMMNIINTRLYFVLHCFLIVSRILGSILQLACVLFESKIKSHSYQYFAESSKTY